MKRFSTFLKVTFALALSLACLSSVHAAVIDPSFATGGGFTYNGYDGNVRLIKILDDGKILVGGSFNEYNGESVQGGLVRLNADLTLDNTFDLGGDGFDSGSVMGVNILDDGKMLVNGGFEQFNGEEAEGILRLNADGTLDETFDPFTGGSNTGGVWDVIVLDDGDYLAAFPSNGGTYRGEGVRGIFRLNSDGSIDNSFSLDEKYEHLYVTVEKMVRQPDGKILAIGSFFYKGLDGEYDYVCDYGDNPECEEDQVLDDEYYRFMRLNPDGSTDNTFSVIDGNQNGFNGINDVALLSDGKMYIGGQFSSYGTASSSYVARLNSDGSVDETFSLVGSFEGGPVYSLLVQDDGKLLVGGQFYSYDDKEYLSLIRFNPDGSVDENLSSNIAGGMYNAHIREMLLLPDGRLMAGGDYIDSYGVGGAEYDIGGALVYFLEPRVILSPGEFSMREGDEASEWDGQHYLVVSINTKPTAPVTVTLSSLNDQIQFSTSTFTFYPSDWSDPVWEGYHPYYGTIVTAVDDSDIEGGHSDEIVVSVSSSDDDYDDFDVDNILVTLADNDSAVVFDQSFIPSGVSDRTNVSVALGDQKVLIGGAFDGGIRRLNADGTEDDSFDIGSGFNSTVRDIKVLANGDYIVVGEFTRFDGETVGHIARLNPDGTLDGGFDAGGGFDDEVIGVALVPGGKLLAWGNFESFDGNDVLYIARLNSDGSLDESFAIGEGFNGGVRYAQVQSDGKIVVGGYFDTYDGEPVPYGLVRLNSDGSVDDDFAGNLGTGFSSAVRFIALQSDEKIIVSGGFDSLDGQDAHYFVRLNSDGTVDGTFVMPFYSWDEQTEEETKRGLNGPVYAISFLEGGKMLVGGDFSIYTTDENDDIPSAVFLLNADGTRDSSLESIAKYNEVTSITVRSDGKILVTDTSSSAAGIRLFGEDGQQDDSFSVWGGYGSGYPGVAKVIALTSGKILAVGDFDRDYYQEIIRINNDGSLDDTFEAAEITVGATRSVYVQSDGKIVAYGDFGVVRLNADGSLDETFDQDVSLDENESGVYRVVPYGDEGQMLVSISGNYNLVRLNADGSLDETFSLDEEVFSVDSGDADIVVLPDGRILISGEIIFNNGEDELAILNADGSIAEIVSEELGFHQFGVHRMVPQADGRILLSGSFKEQSNSPTKLVIRLNADFTHDTSFVVTDSFGQYQINDIKIQEDGAILVAGYSGQLVRLLPDGTIDESFMISEERVAFEDAIFSVDVDSENKIVVGGQMETFRGVRVQNIVRLIDTALLEDDGDIDTDSPIMSAISVTSNNSTEVRLTFTTNELTSGRIYYGPTSSYGFQTDEFNTNPRLVSHSIVLNNLDACTTYHYQVLAEDSSANITISSDGTFKTLGCESSSSGPSSGVRRSPVSVSVSAPFVPSVSVDTRGLSIQQIISLLARFMNPSVVDVLNNTSVVGTSTPSSASSGSSSPAPRPSSIRRNLTVGSVGDDVRQLQSFLIQQNGSSTTRAQALANVGATGYFGTLTRAALAEYQAANGVVPSAGFFGPVTRGVLEQRGQ